jgi:hypothetical protein
VSVVGALIGRTIGLLVVWTVVAAVTIGSLDGVAPGRLAGVVGWSAGFVVVGLTWRAWHHHGRKLDVERRALGAKLRRERPGEYRRLLGDAKRGIARTDPDRYVGHKIAAPERRRFRWAPPTGAQRAAVEQLTADELENATLVRSLEDGAAEVLGVKDDIGYLYRVDAAGAVTLVSRDESKARTLRTLRRMAGTGIVMFAGSFVPLLIWHRDGRVPGWLVPIMVVGFVLAFIGFAASTGPKHFLPEGEQWDAVGSGWDSGD